MESLKYFKYDLNEENIRRSGAFDGEDIKVAWNIIREAFSAVGFSHPQESSALSEVPMSTMKAERYLEEVCLRVDFARKKRWLHDGLKELSLSDIVEYKEMSGIIKDMCNGIKPDYSETNIKEHRYITYDLTRVNLTNKGYPDVIGLKEYGKSPSVAYKELRESLAKHGFECIQKSAFVSKKPMTEKQMMDSLYAVCQECPWLYQCAKSVEMSVRGERIEQDMINFIKSFQPSKEVFAKLTKVREDLFLTLHIEGKKVFCYANDEKNDKFYKYELTGIGVADQAFGRMLSLSVDIMNRNFTAFQGKEVSKEEYKKSIIKTEEAFMNVFMKNPVYNMELTTKNIGELVIELREIDRKTNGKLPKALKVNKKEIIKEYGLEKIEYPSRFKKFSKNDRNALMEEVAKATDVKCKDFTVDKIYYALEKNQLHRCVRTEVCLPKGCPIGYKNHSHLWTDAINKERAFNSVVMLKTEMAIPKGMSKEDAVELTKMYVQDAFVKYGHATEFSIVKDRNNPDSMKAIIFIADRKLENGKFIEKKLDKRMIDGKEIQVRFGTDVRFVNIKKNLRWLDSVNNFYASKGIDKKCMYNYYLPEFQEFIDKVKEAKGNVFDKSKVSLKRFTREYWKKKLNKVPDLEQGM